MAPSIEVRIPHNFHFLFEGRINRNSVGQGTLVLEHNGRTIELLMLNGSKAALTKVDCAVPAGRTSDIFHLYGGPHSHVLVAQASVVSAEGEHIRYVDPARFTLVAKA